MRNTPPRITSLPLGVLTQVSLAYGNRGIAQQRRSYSTLCDEVMAHTLAFHGGQEFDPESGHHHLAEAAAAAMSLLNLVFAETGEDDRPTPVRVDPEEVAKGLNLVRQPPTLIWPRGPEDEV